MLRHVTSDPPSPKEGNWNPANRSQPVDVAVVILTYNEEENLGQALGSVSGWARQVFVFDSFSSDHTLDVARRFDCEIGQHPFADYASQRNASLDELPIEAEWVFVLDADEWMTDELKGEIEELLSTPPKENAFFVKRRLIWMGRWVRWGIYPNWSPRLFRLGKARYDSRAVNEHLSIEGEAGYLRNDFMHEDLKPISNWVAKHNRYSTMEAREILRKSAEGEIDAKFWGKQQERTRWLRRNVWYRLPPLIRPLLYFVFRYILRGGFLDGRAGFAFHFLHALWFQMLIDIKYLEMKRRGEPEGEND